MTTMNAMSPTVTTTDSPSPPVEGEMTLEDMMVRVRKAMAERMHEVLTYIEQATPDDTTPEDLKKLQEEMLDTRTRTFSPESIETLHRLWSQIREAVLQDLRVELLEYYQSDKGREEIQQSPHKDKPPGEIVELILKDIGEWMLLRRAGSDGDEGH